jgi:NAD-dependent deacetylase
MDLLKEFGNSTNEISIADAIKLVQNAKRIAVLTGAGISAESGIQTFRDGNNAHWNRFDPAKLASMDGFKDDPQLVWDWYGQRMGEITMAQPNAAHYALAKLAKHKSVSLFTQNIDDLHERAGSQVTHFHGDIATARCFEEHGPCGWVGNANETVVRGTMPGCPKCASIARPNVVWFGELLDSKVLTKATDDIYNSDLIFSIGTSNVVEPVASLPFTSAAPSSVFISVNKRKSDHSPYADKTLTGLAGAVMSQVVNGAFP